MDSLHTYEPRCKDILGSFEAQAEINHKKMMCEEIKADIERRDIKISEAADRTCPACGALVHSHGKTAVIHYLTTSGEVSVRLRRLRCTSCRHIVVPARHLIPKDKVSASLAEWICDLASKMPYHKAVESLFIQHGITMSAKRFWGCIQKEAKYIDDVLAKEAKTLYETGQAPLAADLKHKKPLIIGIDGGHVKGWKASPSFEVRCATLATGSASGPKTKRCHLLDRVGYATLSSLEDFRKRVSVLAIKSGYQTASVRIFVSDGAAWISKMITDWFPDAIHVLDMYHLKNRVHLLFGKTAQGKDAKLRDEVIQACEDYRPDRIICLLKLWEPSDLSKAEALEDLAGYVVNNALAIRNHRRVGIHGSGWIEKGVDLMISRRMKNRGMAWTEAGGAHIIPFAVLRYNRQWDVYWNKRKGLCDLSAA